MSMGTWKARLLRKQRGSRTPGKTKGESCKADWWKKYMAKTSRSYKHPEYFMWCKICDQLNGRAKV